MIRTKLPFYLVLIAGLWLLTDLYAVTGIRTLAEQTGAGLTVVVLYWLVSVGILLNFFYRLSRFFSGNRSKIFFGKALTAFLTMLVTRLAFIAVLLAEDLYRALAGLWSVYPERSPVVAGLALLIACIPLSAFWFGTTRGKYHYQVRRVKLEFGDLPPRFDGFRIVQLSDIHAGSFDNAREVARGIDLLNSQRPDLFVFTGDLVNNRADEVRPYLNVFREIHAPFGKFSVLGNHDYGDYISWPDPEAKRSNLRELIGYHRELGFRLLLDTHAIVQKGEDRLVILGVENWGTGFGHRGDLEKALAGVHPSEFKILLSHDPTHWESEVKTHPAWVHLTLSGHTHGMQFGIEAFGLKWSPVQYRYRNWAGLVQEAGRYLYINRGFGFLGFSGRVGIWPEITVLELRRKDQASGPDSNGHTLLSMQPDRM